MSDNTITSANSILTLVASSLFPAPVNIEGYATDKSVFTSSANRVETMMGVDGKASFGYTPQMLKMTITLQADSPSIAFFNTIVQSMITTKDVYVLTGNLVLPSTGLSYSLNRGAITTDKPIADLAKVQQPVEYEITWESISPSVI